MSILTLKEMRNVILTKNAAVSYNGKVISRKNIHELPSEAEWTIFSGQNTDAVDKDLENQIAQLEKQRQLLQESKKVSAETKPVEDKKQPKVKLAGEVLPDEVLSSSVASRETKK